MKMKLRKRGLLFLLLLSLVFSLSTVNISPVQGETYNGVELTRTGDIITATSPGKYQLSQGVSSEPLGLRHWNLTRLGSTNETVFLKAHYWMRCNNTGQGSMLQPIDVSVSNSSFSDSLGSGMMFNVTYTNCYIGGAPQYGFTVKQIWSCYPDFVVEEIMLINNYSDAVRRLQSPKFVLYGGYKNFKVGAAATTRLMVPGTQGYDKSASEGFVGRPPFFAYNTAEDKGVVIGILKNTWDWCVYRQAYGVEDDPPLGISVDAYTEYPNEYLDLAYGETYLFGKMFIELTKRQIDDAFCNLGTAYKTLYPGRTVLSGYNAIWNSWSAYSSDVCQDNITLAAEYIENNLKNYYDLETVVLDGGYCDWGNWTEPDATRFPDGLEWLANNITSRGLKAGIWLAPWRIGSYALDNATMKSWLLNSTQTGDFKTGEYLGTYYVLNPTIADARAWVSAKIDQLEAWGYTYFKMDFLSDVMDTTQMYGSGNTRATWIEWAHNISTTVNSDHYVLLLAIQPFGSLQPYLAQQYANSVRFSMDLTKMDWTSTIQAYEAYHTVSSIFNYLTVDLDRDMLGDWWAFADAPWADQKSEDEYKFQLTFLGITKIWCVSDDYDQVNTTKLEWQKAFLPFESSSWTQRDYHKHLGVPRTWLTSKTLMGNTYYYMAVFNPTINPETFGISFVGDLGIPSGTYLIYKNFEDVYVGTSSSGITVSLAPKSSRIYTLLKKPAYPKTLAWEEKDHITISQITSMSWVNPTLTYTLESASGTNSTTHVYCANRGNATSVTGALTWSYDSTTKLITVIASHTSAKTITITWVVTAPYIYTFHGSFNEETGELETPALVNVTAYFEGESTITFEVDGIYEFPSWVKPIYFTFDLVNDREYWLTSEEDQIDIYIFNGNTSVYTIQFLDLAGVLDEYAYVPCKRYVNGILHTIEKRKVDVEKKVIMSLINGAKYTITIQDETTYTFGDLLMTDIKTIILTLKGIEFPQEVILAFKYVRLYAERHNNLTSISMVYQDLESDTDHVDCTVKFRNGTVAYTSTQYSDYFNVTWTSAEYNITYVVQMDAFHNHYGEINYRAVMYGGHSVAPWSLAFLGAIPGMKTSDLIPLFLIFCAAGIFSRVNAETGAFMAVAVAMFLTWLGWITILPSLLVMALFFTILMGLAAKKRRVAGV